MYYLKCALELLSNSLLVISEFKGSESCYDWSQKKERVTVSQVINSSYNNGGYIKKKKNCMHIMAIVASQSNQIEAETLINPRETKKPRDREIDGPAKSMRCRRICVRWSSLY